MVLGQGCVVMESSEKWLDSGCVSDVVSERERRINYNSRLVL